MIKFAQSRYKLCAFFVCGFTAFTAYYLTESGREEAAPVFCSDKTLVITLCAILVVGLVCGFAFFTHYDMSWQPVTETLGEDQAEIKAKLLSLGFPEDVLDDLDGETLYALADAEFVFSETEDAGEVNNFKAVRITSIAVRLSGGEGEWRVLHYFEWKTPPKNQGADCLELGTAESFDEHVYRDRFDTDFTKTLGRVLCTTDAGKQTAPMYDISDDSVSSLFGSTNVIVAEFSFPSGAQDCRGYVMYKLLHENSEVLYSSRNCVHQRSNLLYPFVTGREYCTAGSLGSEAFDEFQVLLSYYELDSEE